MGDTTAAIQQRRTRMLVKARTCGDARRPVLMQLEPLGRARRPNQEKVDDARHNLRVAGRRTEVDIQPRTLLVRIWKCPLHNNAIQPNPNTVQSEPMSFYTCRAHVKAKYMTHAPSQSSPSHGADSAAITDPAASSPSPLGDPAIPTALPPSDRIFTRTR